MAAPAFGSVGTYAGNANRSGGIALARPSGTALNDLLIAFVYEEATNSVTPPSGWAEVPNTPSTSSPKLQVVRAFWKRATATEVAAGSSNFLWSGSVYSAGFIARFTGVRTTDTPFDGIDSAARSSSGSTTPAVSVTTTGADRLLVWCGSTWDTTDAASSWTPPPTSAGWVERVDGDQLGMASRLLAAQGSSGNVSGTAAVSSYQTAWLLALRGDAALRPAGIASAEAFGTPTVTPGLVEVGPAGGIPSDEAFGSPTVAPGQEAGPAGAIPSAEAFGTPTVTPGLVTVRPAGVPSAAAFGIPTATPGLVTLQPAGIPSAEEFGEHRARFGLAESDLPRAYARTETPYPEVEYELACVARIPQQTSPPLFIEVDPIDWTGLKWGDELGASSILDAKCQMSQLTEPVRQLVLALHQTPVLATELWLSRNGRRVFAGPLLGVDKQGEEVTLQCRGLLHYVQRMVVLDDYVRSGLDQALIAQQLIDQWQVTEHGHFGLNTTQLQPTGVLRDVTYLQKELHKVDKVLAELGKQTSGFDLEVDPVTRSVLMWSPQMGVDRSTGEDAIIFDTRNVTSPAVQMSAGAGDLASDAIVTGTGPDGQVFYSVRSNPDLRATWGRTAVTGTFDQVTDQATADAHAQAMVDARRAALVIPGPNVRTTTDADLSAYDVGDTVHYQVDLQLGIEGAFRIRKRTVTVNKEGREETAVEFV